MPSVRRFGQEIPIRPNRRGARAVAGGVVGGVIGDAVFGDAGAMVIGAAGGAVAGTDLERHLADVIGYWGAVRLDNGGQRTFTRPESAVSGRRSGSHPRWARSTALRGW